MSAVIDAPVTRSAASERAPPRAATTAAALAIWLGAVWLAHVWGMRLVHRDPRARIFAAPLAGRFEFRFGGWRVLPVLALAAVSVALGPRLARTLPWRRLLLFGFVLAAGWAVALAFVDGRQALTAPLITRWDYLVDVPKTGDLHTFLGGFASNLDRYSTHVRAHPPGMLVLLRALAGIGLKGVGAEAVIVTAAGAAVVPAALLALRELAGQRMARNAWPFLAVAPAALWIATSVDALYAGVGAWGVALVVLATGRSDRRAIALATAGGLLLGAAAFLSYGLLLLWLIPVSVVVVRRAYTSVAVAGSAAAVVGLAFAAAGFWWPAGLAATHAEYLQSAARARPQSYFWVGNLGAFALALGPATAVALARLRNARVWLLVGAGLAIVAIADSSGLSKGEVERIWLPFAPWILLAAACFDGEPESRGWLGIQAAVAVALQLAVRSPW